MKKQFTGGSQIKIYLEDRGIKQTWLIGKIRHLLVEMGWQTDQLKSFDKNSKSYMSFWLSEKREMPKYILALINDVLSNSLFS